VEDIRATNWNRTRANRSDRQQIMKNTSVVLVVVSLFSVDALSAEGVQERLDAKSAAFAEKAPPEVMASQRKAAEALRATGIVEKAMKAGDLAPDFTLKDHEGRR